jgi:hypothetical protein
MSTKPPMLFETFAFAKRITFRTRVVMTPNEDGTISGEELAGSLCFVASYCQTGRRICLRMLLSNMPAGANRRRMLICRATLPAV